MALTRKGVPFVWIDRQQTAFEALKACLISAPILGFPTEDGRFLLEHMPACLQWGGGGGSESDSRRSGGGYRVCQPQSSPVSTAILSDTSRNAGGGSNVHAFPVVSSGGSVHPSYGSQFSPMATEVP